MAQYGCSFQHFQTGFWITAGFEKEILELDMLDTFEDWINMYEKRPSDEEIREMKEGYEEAAEWVKRNNGKRFKNVDDAQKYLIDMGIDCDFDK